MTTLSIALFVLLEVKHFLFDFVVQTRCQLKNKMPLNFTQPALDRDMGYSGFQQALRQLGFPLAAVEAVDELVDVVLQI
ncbi:MAG TPA: hypothetical protein VFA48_11605, partial [Gammaproteobacteria bacterium]|nr:hypothetical protein [Gammaproteobacteria bacterium]